MDASAANRLSSIHRRLAAARLPASPAYRPVWLQRMVEGLIPVRFGFGAPAVQPRQRKREGLRRQGSSSRERRGEAAGMCTCVKFRALEPLVPGRLRGTLSLHRGFSQACRCLNATRTGTLPVPRAMGKAWQPLSRSVKNI